MAEPFYPFVGDQSDAQASKNPGLRPSHAARVAVYDDPLSMPRVVEIEPTDVRSYLEQITETTSRLAREQGSSIPFMVIREVVENLIHAYFEQPTVSILDSGDTICFSDRGPGIANKDLARQYGTSSATEEMRRYIRGVGSGLPYVEAWLDEHGGTLEIEDNIAGGTMVTVSLVRGANNASPTEVPAQQVQQPSAAPQGYAYAPVAQPGYAQPYPAQGVAYTVPTGAYGAYPAGYQMVPQPVYQQVPGQVAYTQPAGSPVQAAVWPQQAVTQPAGAPQPALVLDQREEQVLTWLATHESVGPKDLVDAYGQSAPTWSRVLNGLEGRGLVRKAGQKRTLTDAGRAWVAGRA